MVNTLILPYPPSMNHYWRQFLGRTLISREGRAFRKTVCSMLSDGRQAETIRLAVCLDVFPPDKRRRDLDNIQKPVLDALQHAGIYEDDGQIDLLITRRRESIPNGRLVVTISPVPACKCQCCDHFIAEKGMPCS